jgi:hypothetical protein
MTEEQLRAQYEKEMTEMDLRAQYEKEMEEGPDTGILETVSDVITTAPQGITSWADEAQAIAEGLMRAGGGEKGTVGEIAEKRLPEIQQQIGAARARSPIATAGGELATGIATSFVPGLGAGKITSGLGTVARGALEGLGTAEDKASFTGGLQALGGGLLGGAGAAVGAGVKKLTTVNPNQIRANILGARSSEFREIGLKEREDIAKKLNEMGLFSSVKVDFDPNLKKFVPRGKSLENLEKPVREKLETRLTDAIDKMQKEKLKIIDNVYDDPINLQGLKNTLDDVAEMQFKKGGRAGVDEANVIKEEILGDIEYEMKDLGLTSPTIGMLEEAKQRIQEKVGAYGRNPLLQKTPETAQIYQEMYSRINKNLRKLIRDRKYSEYNDLQQKMLTAKTDVLKAIASENAQAMEAGFGGILNKAWNSTIGSPEAKLGAANIAGAMQMPGLKQLQTPLRLGVEEAPFAGIRYLDPSIPRYLQRPEEPKRTPQSLNFSPEDIVNYRLPLSTEGLLAEKDMVLAKLTQEGLPDNMLDTVAQALNGDPEDLSSIAPLLMTQFPGVFKKAKYKVFDGKFLDPNDRAKAADDTSKREDLNSIQRAKMINQINKFNRTPEGLE